MFVFTQYKLGDYTVAKLYNPETQTGFEVIPGFGARLNSLKFSTTKDSGIEVIDGFQPADDIANDQYYKSALLFPFPNRLKDGSFSINGSTFQFPVNERERNNAIHGFIADKLFDVVAVNTTEDEAEIRLSYKHNTQLHYYPFQFELLITYTLKAPGIFSIAIEVCNNSSEPMPFGLGWHPYFTLPGWENVKLKISKVDQIELDERALPSGNINEYTALTHFKGVGKLCLDDCFALIDQQKNMATLKNGKIGLDIWRDVSTIPYLQVYTPERNCVAIEPMTCNIDALNNKMGIVSLEPHESFNTSFGVSLAVGY
ncbi:Putative aldose-1-epimerase [Fulvivirga imtechensis AK7]|uniref:Putative aldose-1-epimerase n=1 Tax=Fulvivirga imtechensis AK7 TaxID=1237149 RepID=L8JRK4_9BACT|nr:aldose 1-epimerase [Fulvivirga imtechensis]ELR71495.1 Putative aldose-1-epimerase [Fulvivirga imtechensis AK7]